jgi:hypothetical protein
VSKSNDKPAKTIAEYINHAWEDGAREERQNVVAWLRAQAYLTLYEASPEDIADRIERGDHRPEGVE